jgi:hypothetical protein
MTCVVCGGSKNVRNVRFSASYSETWCRRCERDEAGTDVLFDAFD